MSKTLTYKIENYDTNEELDVEVTVSCRDLKDGIIIDDLEVYDSNGVLLQTYNDDINRQLQNLIDEIERDGYIAEAAYENYISAMADDYNDFKYDR